MKRKTITQTVHPAILDRAKVANQSYNEHLAALRQRGITRKVMTGSRKDGTQIDVGVPDGIPLDLSTLMVEVASIVHAVKGLKDGN